MTKQEKYFLGDKDIQFILGTLLRVGVLLATAIVIIGGFVYLSANAQQTISYADFKPEQVKFTSIKAIFLGLKSFEGLAIIQFGVLLLIFTPIARVVFSIFSFLLEKDYMYVLIGLIVLIVILASLYLDVAH